MVSLTDPPDMASDVYRGPVKQQNKKKKKQKKKISRRGCGGRGSMCVWRGGKGLQLRSESLHCLRTVI